MTSQLVSLDANEESEVFDKNNTKTSSHLLEISVLQSNKQKCKNGIF
jgi:hypothetical protein